MSTAGAAPKTVMQRFLDGVEKVGNMVPHPVIIFLILIAIVIGLSALLGTFGASITFERINPESHEIEAATTSIRSLLNTDGIRFMYESLIPNFMSFTAVGLMIAAMVGAGVAEESGLVTALIRKLVIVSPRWALTYILAFVGIIASVAADAGYLVLIPLAGIAYLAVGRHPLLALGFAAVARGIHCEHADQAARRGYASRRHSRASFPCGFPMRSVRSSRQPCSGSPLHRRMGSGDRSAERNRRRHLAAEDFLRQSPNRKWNRLTERMSN
ncbi:putative AbgT family transporter [Rhizobium mongolense USDA 1844]|uniref:Putative AbgT family transporter n=1 Tax=Rhizobium mongolense USDA 1844 TaxID=1079460 RepID=A0A559SMI3_9HYPH|nr:putative AbgT family transporter [Rhizobium mongolense USDA 1844]